MNLAMVALAAGVNMLPIHSTVSTPPLDSVGVSAGSVPRAARQEIDAFIRRRERPVSADDAERRREVGERRYFLRDLDGDGVRDVAVIYDMRWGQADNLWLLFAMGPHYREILHAQVGTDGRGRCRYARFRRIRNRSFEFSTLYYEPNAPMCCASVPGWSSYEYSGGDILEHETIIDWAERVVPGEGQPWR